MYLNVIGIDISKDSFDLAVVDKLGKISKELKLPMDREGFNKLLEITSNLDKSKTLISMEATGIYHIPLLSFLLEENFKCVVINPLLIKSYIQATTLRKSKTDKKDALLIATFALKSFEHLKLCNIDSLNTIKPLIRERESLSCEIAKLKTEIKTSLQQLFPELSKNYNIFTKSILYLLLEAPSAKRIRNFKEKKIERFLNEMSGNKTSVKAKDILNLAKNSIAISNKHLEIILTSKIRRLQTIQDELSIIDEEIESSITDDINDDIEILTSIPGIGEVTSKNFIIEIEKIDKFQSYKQVSAFIGIDPSIKQSGSSVNYQGKITKRGNSYLRRTIWQMATSVIRYNQKFKDYYTKKRLDGKKYKQAVIAVANKLIRLIFTLLKNRTQFQADYV